MGKRAVIWLGALGAAIAFLVVIALSSKEPRYAQRPLSFWVDQLPATLVMTNGYSMAYPAAYATLAEGQADQARVLRAAAEARAAIKGLGSQCLPSLLRRLNTRSNSRLSNLAVRWALRLHLLKLSSPLARSADYTRGQALTALLELGDAARPAAPELVVLAQSKDPGVKLAARHALERLAPDELNGVRHE